MIELAILGLGLIGGSLAAAVRARGLGTVVAIDRGEVLQSEAAAALADLRVEAEDVAAVATAMARADLVVLSTPVSVIEQQLPAALDVARTVTDCGSTKRAVARCAARHPRAPRFVPGHPMAGAPAGGLVHARADLFVGRRWILCPERSEADAVRVVASLASAVGAEVVELTAVEHDRVVAMTSHVPQVLSSLLAVLGARRTALSGAGPAFLSATRRAGGGEAMWRDIFASNADEVAAALRDVAQELDVIAEALGRESPDLEPVLRLLARARAVREG